MLLNYSSLSALLLCLFLLCPQSASGRKAWEVGRFLRTATFYDALLPKIPFFRTTTSKGLTIQPNSVLWNTKDPSQSVISSKWGPLDDVVMGGVSKTSLEPGQAFNGSWSGYVTSENNGGFAGLRTKPLNPALDLSACKGIQLRVTGDGQRYKFILRDEDDWNGVAWAFSFDTSAGRSVQISVPFDKLKPTRFARVLTDGRRFKKNQISAIQLSLSKFEYDGGLNGNFREGPFRLELQEIRTF
eukprot:gene5343-5879_t